MPMLRTGDLDMIVGRMPEYRHRENNVQEVLFQEQMVVVSRKGHPLTQYDEVKFQQLPRYEWILPPSQTTLRRQIDKEFFDRGFSLPSNAVECVSFLTNRTLLMTTDMLCVLPYQVVKTEVDQNLLEIIPYKLNISSGPVGVSYRSQDALSPAAAEFLEGLRHTASSLT